MLPVVVSCRVLGCLLQYQNLPLEPSSHEQRWAMNPV